MEQSLFHGVIPTLAKVKGQFLNERDRWKSSDIILKSQLHKHKKLLFRLIEEHGNYRQITNSVLLHKLLNNFVLKTLRNENTFQLSTKNKKLRNLRPKQSSYNSSNKNSSVVILDRACYKEKINRSINDGTSKGVYDIKENDNTLTELKSFQNFIYRNFKKHEKNKEVRPTSGQPTRLFATAMTHKFTDTKQININNLKLCPIRDQTGTHLYDC